MRAVTISFLFVLLFMASDISFVSTLDNVESSTVDNLASTLCSEPGCIMKCCPIGKYFIVRKKDGKRERLCEHAADNTADFASLAKEVFREYPVISTLNLTVKDGIFDANESFKTEAVYIYGLFELYLTDRPDLLLEHPNAYERWTRIPNDKFCFEYKITRSGNLQPGIWVVFSTDELGYEPLSETMATYMTTCMLVSCFFLGLVMLVYGVLKELLTLEGKIILAYAVSLFGAFLFLAAIRIELHFEMECIILTYLIHYFFLASFCWTNVMSYEIWRTSRNNLKFHPVERRSDCCVFLLFCLYAFGLPLAITSAMAIVNHIEMSHMPWFITPKIPSNGCFLEGGEKFLYLYVPMLIQLSINWLFILKTVVNTRRLRRRLAYLGSTGEDTQNRNKFTSLLMLLVVLNLTWLLEVVSHRYPGYKVWRVSDTINNLTGVTVFLIFVCRREVLTKLVNKFRSRKTLTESITSKSVLQIQENR